VDNGCFRAAAQEFAGVTVELAAAEDQRRLFILGQLEPFDSGEGVALPLDQSHGPLVFDQRVRPLRFHRPEVERDEIRLGLAA